MFSTDSHTAYSGPTDIKTRFRGLLEMRVLEDFEGQVYLGLGVNQTSCYHAVILNNPTRLVIDIRRAELARPACSAVGRSGAPHLLVASSVLGRSPL